MYTPRPGDYGVVKTNGIIGRLIRIGTTSRWNHAFIYIGGGVLVEARPTGVTLNRVDQYTAYAFNQHEDITQEQRDHIVDHAMAQVGKPYGFIDITVIFLRIFGLKIPNLKIWNKLSKKKGFICSELVAESYRKAGFVLINKPDGIVTPGDLAERLIYQ